MRFLLFTKGKLQLAERRKIFSKLKMSIFSMYEFAFCTLELRGALDLIGLERGILATMDV